MSTNFQKEDLPKFPSCLGRGWPWDSERGLWPRACRKGLQDKEGGARWEVRGRTEMGVLAVLAGCSHPLSSCSSSPLQSPGSPIFEPRTPAPTLTNRTVFSKAMFWNCSRDSSLEWLLLPQRVFGKLEEGFCYRD